LHWIRKAGNQDFDPTYHDLGYLYETGKGVSRDYTQAAVMYLKAAQRALSDSQMAIGYLYLEGKGVPQDYSKSVEWFRKAAEQGWANG
jgi:uncharacterized protein